MKVAIQTVNGRFSGELVTKEEMPTEAVRMGIRLSGPGPIYLRDAWHEGVGKVEFVVINPDHVVSIGPPATPPTRTVTTNYPSSVG